MTAAIEGVSRVSDARTPTPATFDEWVAARSPALLRFAVLVTGNAADAQDTVQDALVAVFPRWAQLQARGTEEAYVRRAIVNRHISVWRSFRRRERPTGDVAELDSPTADPGDATGDAEIAWRLCQTLPRVQRAAVVLRYYEDQPYAQIAQILDCTESTARSHVRRALHALRTQLEGGGTDD